MRRGLLARSRQWWAACTLLLRVVPSRIVALSLALLVVAVGCVEANKNQSGGESHFGNLTSFLRVCEDGRCAGEDSCFCSVCTVSCVDLSDCRGRILSSEASAEDLPDNVVCRAPMCAANVSDEETLGMGSVCDVSCQDDRDCDFLSTAESSEYSCDEGLCRTRKELEDSSSAPLDAASHCPPEMAFVPTGVADAAQEAFCLERTEVTVAQYELCVESGDCAAPEAGNYLTAGREQHPVQFVSPVDAEAFCAFAGRELPTRLQFAWAAGEVDQVAYPWGDDEPTADDLPPRVCAFERTNSCEVGQFSAGASSAGVLDLSGNVAELVRDGDGHCAAGGVASAFQWVALKSWREAHALPSRCQALTSGSAV